MIGEVRTREPRRESKSSGEAETIVQPSPASGSGSSGRSGASACARPAGSPSKSALKCCTRFTWYTSPSAIAARTTSTASAYSLSLQLACQGPTAYAPGNGVARCAGSIEYATVGNAHGSGGAGAPVRRSTSEAP